MKARRKGTDAPFEEVEYVQLRDSYVITKADQMEFENESKSRETSDGIDYWEKLRHQAAIEVMPALIGLYHNGGDFSLKFVFEDAVFYADKLIEELKK